MLHCCVRHSFLSFFLKHFYYRYHQIPVDYFSPLFLRGGREEGKSNKLHRFRINWHIVTMRKREEEEEEEFPPFRIVQTKTVFFSLKMPPRRREKNDLQSIRSGRRRKRLRKRRQQVSVHESASRPSVVTSAEHVYNKTLSVKSIDCPPWTQKYKKLCFMLRK